MNLDGRTAVVTGAASGIGRAVAERFAAAGAAVLAVDIATDVDWSPAPTIVAHEGDVSDERSVREVFERAGSMWSGLDVLCNAAGVLAGRARLVEVEAGSFDRVMAVNARGTFLCMRDGLPLMQRRGGGSVVNIASIASLVGHQGSVSYIASKGAVLAMTRAAALEHAAEGIRVNAICPGTIDTPLVRQGLAPEELSRFEALHPVGRLGRPEEIAAMALFLASDECPFATGAAFVVDGGRTAA